MINMLLVDIGNSRIKWALNQRGEISVQGNHSYEEITRKFEIQILCLDLLEEHH